MDFGWNKSGQDDQNNAPATVDPVKTTNSATPVVVAATTTPATTSAPWDLPKAESKPEAKSDDIVEEKGSDFANSKPDDSFDNDFTVDPSSIRDDEGIKEIEEKEAETAGDDVKIEVPSADEIKEEDTENETEDKAEEIIVEDKPVETEEPKMDVSADGKSLTELEKDITDKRDKVGKELADLQEKVSKFDGLLSKVQKMKDEEKNLIEEISSTL
jgi:hypothetical protein